MHVKQKLYKLNLAHLKEHPSIRQDESSRQETVSTDRIIDCDALQCTTLRPAPKSSTDDSGSPLRTENRWYATSETPPPRTDSAGRYESERPLRLHRP